MGIGVCRAGVRLQDLETGSVAGVKTICRHKKAEVIRLFGMIYSLKILNDLLFLGDFHKNFQIFYLFYTFCI